MNREPAFTGKYHAALYIRLSKEDDNEGPSQSVTNQQALLREFASEHDIDVYDEYIDDGWSGTNFDRPAFGQMIEDIETGNVNMVITKDLSRLGRDYILTGHYMERYFPEHGVRYISLLDGIDTGVDSTANDITPFRAIMNDMYAKDISKKIKSVKRDKQRRGQFIGGKPVYGYRMNPAEKNKIVIDEPAATVVRKIFSMAGEGLSCRRIAIKLNAEKIPPPSVYSSLGPTGKAADNRLWSSERISEMLQNETYIGNMVQGRRKKINYKSKKCRRQPREDWVIVEKTHEPIIDTETFKTVNVLLASRRHTRSRTYDFPLKGLIFCHECGRPLGVINRKNAAGEDVLYLVCRTYQRFGGECSSHIIKETAVSDTVFSKITRLCQSAMESGMLLKEAETALKNASKTGAGEQEQANLGSRIQSLNSQLDKAYMDKLSGAIENDDFQRIYGNIKLERQEAEQRLDRLKNAGISEKTVNTEELVEAFIKSIPDNRRLLASLVERLELTEDKQVIIKFRFSCPKNIM